MSEDYQAPSGAELSPAAQAVMHTCEDWLELPIANQRYGPLAAALRAAADQVVPEWKTTPGGSKVWQSEPVPSIRTALLAIAAELERAQ